MSQPVPTPALLAMQKESLLRYCEEIGYSPTKLAEAHFAYQAPLGESEGYPLRTYEGDVVDAYVATLHNRNQELLLNASEQMWVSLQQRFDQYKYITSYNPQSCGPMLGKQETANRFESMMSTIPALTLHDSLVQAYVNYTETDSLLRPHVIVINNTLMSLASEYLTPFLVRLLYRKPELRSPGDQWLLENPEALTDRQMVEVLAGWAKVIALRQSTVNLAEIPVWTRDEFSVGAFCYWGMMDFILFHEISHVAFVHNPCKANKLSELQADQLAAELLWNPLNPRVQVLHKSGFEHNHTLARAIGPCFWFRFMSLVEAILDRPQITHPSSNTRAGLITALMQRQLEVFSSDVGVNPTLLSPGAICHPIS